MNFKDNKMLYSTILVTVYIGLFIFLIGDVNFEFLGENGEQGGNYGLWLICTAPVLIWYVQYLIKHINSIKFFRFLVYPLMLINVTILGTLSLAIFGGIIFWLVFFIIIPLIIIVIPAFIFGLYTDIMSLKKNKKK